MSRRPSQLDKETLQEFQEAFELFDEDKDGKISRKELAHMMTQLGQTPDQQELDDIMKSADKDGNGAIDFEEFVEVMAMAPRDPKEQLMEAFKIFDKDGSGSISADEIRNVMKNLGDKMSDLEIEELIREIDLDGDGEIDYEEFVQVLLKK